MPNRTCQPSEACRISPADISARLGAFPVDAAVLRTIGMIVGRTSGAQNMAWSCDDPAGSVTKAEAPSPSECCHHDGIGFGMRELTMVAVVIRIAAKAFPGKAGWLQFPGAIIGRK